MEAARQNNDDPYAAYAAGAYDQALEGLVREQVERPDDPDLELNIGSAHYQMRNYQEAERSYLRAALAPEAIRRSQALYNLGNTAYRQGKLGEAVDHYMAALELDPDDEDAKFNLEFVREEIRRRQEQQQQQQQQQQGGEDGSQEDSRQDQGESSPQPQPSDRDSDGLPDELERSGRNPTDPENPDTDGDGRSDGEEDANRNGQVDEGETDPNRPDGAEGGAHEERSPEPSAEGDQGSPVDGRELTEEEAERFLQALEEGRPENPQRGSPARRARVEKDW